ncbi:MAG: hypothetical protein ACLRXC_08135 [[Clostridium] leptum]
MRNGQHTSLLHGLHEPLPEGRAECASAAIRWTNKPALYLLTVLSDWYLVGRVFYAGGDLAEYIGLDQVSKSPIVIREFLPDTLCTRGDAGSCRFSADARTPSPIISASPSHARALPGCGSAVRHSAVRHF